jgi:hypothetical protein
MDASSCIITCTFRQVNFKKSPFASGWLTPCGQDSICKNFFDVDGSWDFKIRIPFRHALRLMLALKLSITKCWRRKQPIVSHRWEAVQEKKIILLKAKFFLPVSSFVWMAGKSDNFERRMTWLSNTFNILILFIRHKSFKLGSRNFPVLLRLQFYSWVDRWWLFKISGADATRRLVITTQILRQLNLSSSSRLALGFLLLIQRLGVFPICTFVSPKSEAKKRETFYDNLTIEFKTNLVSSRLHMTIMAAMTWLNVRLCDEQVFVRIRWSVMHRTLTIVVLLTAIEDNNSCKVLSLHAFFLGWSRWSCLISHSIQDLKRAPKIIIAQKVLIYIWNFLTVTRSSTC